MKVIQRKNRFIHTLSAVLIFALLLSFIQCKKEEAGLSAVVTFASGMVTVSGKAVNAGDRVSLMDIIATGDKSLAVVQFGNEALITLRGNTSVQLNSLVSGDDKNVIRLKQEFGNTFSKIIKKNTRYNISTTTITASVRGTSFSLISDRGNQASLKILDGKVLVRKTGPAGEEDAGKLPGEGKTGLPLTKDEIVLEAGYKIDATKEIIGRPVKLEEPEKKELNTLNTVEFVEKEVPKEKSGKDAALEKDRLPAGDKSIEDKSLKKDVTTIKPALTKETELSLLGYEKKPSDMPADKALTPQKKQEIYIEKLNAIKVRNRGKLDRIKLTSGRVIVGMIVERGLTYRIETPYGYVIVEKDDIVSQTITY